MPRFVRLTPADARHVPWKNGRGVTEEIALGPPGASFEAGDFDWRVSRAGVVEDGPFSTFPGLDRVLVVTDGAGLEFSHGAGAPGTRVGPFTPYRFRGDGPTVAALLDGPVRDLNAMVRRGRRRADVAVHRLGRDAVVVALPRGDALVHAVTGLVRVRAPGAGPEGRAGWRLAPGESLHAADVASPTALELHADAPSIVIVVALPVDDAASTVAG